MQVIKFGFLLFLLVYLTGCETAEYYTNPNSAGYQEQALGAICEICGRTFAISGHQHDHIENVTCPYDGHLQNTKYANNRYVYQEQIYEQQKDQAFWQRRQQYWQERSRQSQENIQNLMRERNQTTHTDCTPNAYGGFKCTSR